MTFTFHLPDSAEAAAALLADDPKATALVGGGTLVVPELAAGVRRPARVVDLSRAGLTAIARADEDRLVLGACCTYQQLLDSTVVRDHVPLLHHVASQITGGIQLRNQGTVGGSAAAGRPHSDVPAVLVALRATMHVRSAARGVRTVPAAAFFRSAYQTALEADELLEAIGLPLPMPSTWSYVKLKFGEGSWPIATVACVATIAYDGTVRDAALVVGAAAAVPLAVLGAGSPPAGRLGPELVDDLVSQAERGLTDPWDDAFAAGDYRRAVVGGLVRRALRPLLATGGRA